MESITNREASSYTQTTSRDGHILCFELGVFIMILDLNMQLHIHVYLARNAMHNLPATSVACAVGPSVNWVPTEYFLSKPFFIKPF
jgi:hypothetical protein